MHCTHFVDVLNAGVSLDHLIVVVACGAGRWASRAASGARGGPGGRRGRACTCRQRRWRARVKAARACVVRDHLHSDLIARGGHQVGLNHVGCAMRQGRSSHVGWLGGWVGERRLRVRAPPPSPLPPAPAGWPLARAAQPQPSPWTMKTLTDVSPVHGLGVGLELQGVATLLGGALIRAGGPAPNSGGGMGGPALLLTRASASRFWALAAYLRA